MMTEIPIQRSGAASSGVVDVDALVPMLSMFKKHVPSTEPGSRFSFADEFGNRIDFSHTVKSAWVKQVVSLITLGKDGFVEIPGDGGRLLYVLRVNDRDHYVFSEVRIDLYGQAGAFVSQIHLPKLDLFKNFIEQLPDDQDLPDDSDDIPHDCRNYEEMFVSD